MKTIIIVAAAVLASMVTGRAHAAGGVNRDRNPLWLDILSLADPLPASVVEDAALLGNGTISDGIAWCCTLVPEGDPAMDKAAVYVERFRRIAPQVRARSKVLQGFLLQATIGHGWTPGRPTPWQKIVYADGRVPYRFCPLGTDFRNYIAAQARTLAAAKPDFFMVDDDTRLLAVKHDGCFCPLHLAGFGARTGRTWTREELVAALEKGETDLADAWRAYHHSTLVDFMRLIRAAFPETIPGSYCTVHVSGARQGFVMPCARVLAGPRFRPAVRLGSAPYWSDGIYDILSIRRAVAEQLASLAPEADVLIEADTCPQVRWQTSATRAMDHMMMLTAEGCRGAKMWWHRLGNPHETRSSAAYLRALGERTGSLRWLASSGFRAAGVWCPTGGSRDWGEDVLGRIGIPCHYGSRAAGDVAALTGDSSATLDATTLTNVLSGPVILDGSAAIALTKRGFGELIGIRAKPWTGRAISFEEIGGVRQTGSSGGAPADLTDRAAGAEELSRFYNRVSALAGEPSYLAPGSVWFANGLGGRVVTIAASIPKPQRHQDFGYCNETRKGQILKALTRLAGGLPGGVAYLGDETVLCEAGRTKTGERIVILDSLDLDVIGNPELAFAERPSALERLTDDGRWERVELVPSATGSTILKAVLTPHHPVIFRLQTAL